MSVVTDHLEQRGNVFEVLPHRQAYTSVDEVLKTLAVRTGSGYALMVIPLRGRHPDRVGQDSDPGAVRNRGFTTVSLVKQPDQGSDDRTW